MSVTISPATHEFPQDWGVTCYGSDEPVWIGGAADYQGALALRASHLEECSECIAYGCYTSARPIGYEVPEINMANRNAADLLACLGVQGEDWYCGSMQASDFHARLTLALGLVHTVDEGIAPGPTATILGQGYDCGRAPGYLEERLLRLVPVAEFALEHGVEVSWG
jgi:hypothetical protein